MAPKKPAASTPALPYDRKLVTAWKNIGEKAATKRYASLRDVHQQPGVWEALAATIDAGKFAPAAIWYLGDFVADRMPPRFVVDVLRARPENYTSLVGNYTILAVALARCLRDDPHALDALADDPAVGALVEVARGEASGLSDGASAATRALLAKEWAAGGVTFPALSGAAGVVERVAYPEDARRQAVTETARRIFGEHLAHDLADAHRARLDAHTAVGSHANAFPLTPAPDALRLAATSMTPDEVCGYKSSFDHLWALSAAWSIDEVLRAAEVTAARNRPDSFMTVNALAVIAVARDPSAAPRVEAHLNLFDHSNQASPSAGYTLEALLAAPAAWKRHFALDVVFTPDASWAVYRGPIAVVLLGSVDPEAAERIATAHADELDFTRINGTDPKVLFALVDAAGPALRRALLLPIFVGYARGEMSPPESLDAHFAFEGSHRDGWIAGYLSHLPGERAVAILRRERDAGRADLAREAIENTPRGPELLAAAGI
jgi:hypothetical protein